MQRSYNYCFTLHNWTEEWLHALHEHFSEHCKFWIFGDEVGKRGVTPHLQGYFEWKDAKTFNATAKRLKAITSPGLHVEPAKKNKHANIIYCTKECRKTWGSDIKVKEPKISERELKLQMREDLSWENLSLREKAAWRLACQKANTLSAW